MIDKIIDVIFMVINAIINILPEYSIGQENALVILATSINTVDQYFPVTTLFEIMGVYCAYYAMLVWVRPLLKLAHIA